MSTPNQYPPEKAGQYPPPQAANAEHGYTAPPLGGNNQEYYPPPPPADSRHGYTGPAQTGQQQEYYPPPPPADAQHGYPGAPSGPPPSQQHQHYEPTSWTPTQDSYNIPPTASGGATAGPSGTSTETVSHGKISAWDKTRNTSKAGFDKLWLGFEKLGVPVNKLSNKIGSEAFWPQSLDKECDKSARILKSFCKDGFYSERPATPNTPRDGPKGKPKVLVKIPTKVIQNAVGLAIFTTMRAGLWVSGAGGSGVLIARLPDGSWSPPSGLLIHTAGVGFMAGIDIYDCVLVINTPEALAAFKAVRLSLGGEVSVAAGPVGIGGIGEFDLVGDKKRKPVWTYLKSRGLYAGVQVDGTIVIERNDENARFYGERIPARDILAGKVPFERVPRSTGLLMEVLKEAEGRKDVNHAVLKEVDEVPPPGDMDVEKVKDATKEQMEQYGHGVTRYA